MGDGDQDNRRDAQGLKKRRQKKLTLKELLGDDVLDGDELGMLAVRVVDEALATVPIQHRAIVVRDHLALCVVPIHTR